MHMGHSHSHHGHEHKEDNGSMSWRIPSLSSKRTIARLVLAAMCSISLPLMRRQSRVEVAVVCIVSLFLGAVECGKLMLSQVALQFSGVRRAWEEHQQLEDRMPQRLKEDVNVKEADRVTWLGVWVNIGLSVFKLVAGIAGRSSAMVADAGHSLSDLISDGVTLYSVRLARLPPDEDHPYGHGRFEAVGAFIIAMMLIAASYGLGNHSYESFLKAIGYMKIPALGIGGNLDGGVPTSELQPTKIALVAAVISIVSKELLYRVTAKVGERLNSQVLIANAWHHRSDALSSVIAFVGIGGAMMGVPVLDSLAGLMVAGMLSLTGLQLGWESVKQLTDTAENDCIDEIGAAVGKVEGVLGFDNLRARRMGSQMLVDVRIQCDPYISATAAHQIAERTRWHVLKIVPQVSDVLVTVSGEQKPCPVVSSLPTQEKIQEVVQTTLSDFPDITQVTRTTVHYKNMVPSVDVFIQVDEKLRVEQVKRVGELAAHALSNLNDIGRAEIHLDLGSYSKAPPGYLAS